MKRKKPGRPVRDTQARIALAEWLRAHPECSQTSLARRLGVKQPLICQFLKGTARPSPLRREMFEAICGIDQRDWLDASERVELQHARSA